jgi:hypothetical protein
VVWNKIKEVGLVKSSCFPYSSDAQEAPDCLNKCDGEDEQTYRVSHFCATTGDAGIRREIQKNGPVVAAMLVYSDFLGYSGGIYKPHTSATRL